MDVWKHDRTKWQGSHSSDVTAVPYDEMYRRIRERLPGLLDRYGDMSTIVAEHTLELLNFEDYAEIDRLVLQKIGRKFQAGAEISALEEPDRYTI